MRSFNIKMTAVTLSVLALIIFSGCNSEILDPNNNQSNTGGSKQISGNFDFKTKRDITISLSTKSEHFPSKPGVPLYFYDNNPLNGGNLITTLMTDAEGGVSLTLPVSNTISELYVHSNAIGLPNDIKLPLSSNGWSGNFETALPVEVPSSTQPQKESVLNLKTLGTWNSLGVPNYLMTGRDKITAELMSRIEASLPEYQNVPIAHPEYVAINNSTCIEINETAEVYVTFLHEGAGYRNVFGYYTYNKLNPPTKASDIANSMTVIFPNSSYYNSGGGLYSGDRVNIGVFPANTVIGWFVISNGWGGPSVTSGSGTYYSNPDLNPETKASNKLHNVILKDPSSDKLIIGFEDLNRESPSTDQDFNDILFSVTSTPVTAIPIMNTPLLKEPVAANKPLYTYLPSQNNFGTLIFEDLWPSLGDYDFNDLVLDYNYTLVSNSSNMVTDMTAHFKIKAIGAGMHNGFGFELPVPASAVSSVTGSVLKSGYIELSGNGTESGQDKAVIIVFDDAYNAMHSSGSAFVNTEINSPKVTPVDIYVTVIFSTPQPISTLLSAPYNPFLIVNKKRSQEIHLANYRPTAKADLSLFGTGDDASKPAEGIYYRNKSNLPWALDISNSFKYPVEHSPVWDAYPKFYPWASSSGIMNADWYNYVPANINDSKIYK